MNYRVEPLADHRVESFQSGNDELDSWLRTHARNATGQGTRTFVLVSEDDSEVLGYFALAPHLVERDDVPRRIGRGAPSRIPAILLGKLALDARLQGRGLGGELLVRALGTVLDAARKAGGKLVVVDAIDDAAASFSAAHDFEAVPGNPRRLVMKLSTAARALDVPWP